MIISDSSNAYVLDAYGGIFEIKFGENSMSKNWTQPDLQVREG